ncbi:VCBS domain-containing protein [Pseudodesulfovibrio indicus]|uniref:VCBS repeat-containing protein n=1 Tax=Pseudodesulfovibrio indicus TaxID=1716143 RepID=A0A126QLQ5_9BACT|nr:VCBS domain-containing protein [Pseudodesulfovibrio indicus]AMK10993.1 hypothetical protein AWY79_07640 [Pseudodesulfovibrio indicus]TDT91994.1 VCBS repeat-containing protein [Pseudodesulfovibrio indicus]
MADPKQLQISLPGAGKTQTYQLTAETPVHFNFDISEAEFTGKDGNLQIAIEGGGTIILEGYQALAEAGTLPTFQMMDGEVVAGDVYLFAFADQGDQTDLETAADGAASGSGAGAYNDDPGAMFAGLTALGGQGDAYDPHLFPTGVDTPENDPPTAIPDAGEVTEQGDVDFNPGIHIITTTDFTITDPGTEGDYSDFATLTALGGTGTWFGLGSGNLGVSGGNDLPDQPEYPGEGQDGNYRFAPPQPPQQDNPYIDNEGGDAEAILIDFTMPQNDVQIVLGGFNEWGDFGRDDASLIVTTMGGDTYTIGLGSHTHNGTLFDMEGNPVGTVQLDFGGQITINLTVDGNDFNDFIDTVTVSSEAAWRDYSSNDFYIKSVTGIMPEPPAAWTSDPDWDPTDWGLPEGSQPTFASYLQYLYPDADGTEARFEAFLDDFGDAYFPLAGDGAEGFFITYPDGAHSDVITSGNLLENDYDVDNLQESLRMFSIDYVGKLDDADPDDGADDGEIGLGVNPDGSLILGGNEAAFGDFDEDADPTTYHEIAGKYGTLMINALGDYQYVLDPDLADHLEEGQIELEQFEYSIVDPGGAVSNTATLTITVYGTNDAPVAVPDFNSAIEQGDSHSYYDPLGNGETVPGDFDPADGNGLVEATGGGYGERIIHSYSENNGSYDGGNASYEARDAQVDYLDTYDDAHSLIDITDVFTNGVNINGVNYTTVSVNTNGTLVFGNEASTWHPDPSALEDSTSPMIAGMWDDLDPGVGGEMYMDIDEANGVITFTWLNIAPNSSGTLEEGGDYQNSMQIRLYDLGNGDFGVEIRYADISWVNSNGTTDNSVPIGGWSNGDGDFDLVDGSHTSAFLDVEDTSNVDHPGVWAWVVRDGEFGDMIEGSALMHDFTTVVRAEGNVLTDLNPDFDGSDDGSALDLDHDGDVEGDAITVIGIYAHGTQQQETFDYHREDADGNILSGDFGSDAGVNTVVDDDGGALRIWGEYGVLVISANGDYTYTPMGDAAEALNYDDSPVERFTYMIMDEHGAIDYANLSITVYGANDAPTVESDSNYIVEFGANPGYFDHHYRASVGGNVLRNDSDVDDDYIYVEKISNGVDPVEDVTEGGSYTEIDGQFGTLKIWSNGHYEYTLDQENDAVQALNVNEYGIPDTLTDTFTYTATNSWDDGVSSSTELNITIVGTNDAPEAHNDVPTFLMANDFEAADGLESYSTSGMTFTALVNNHYEPDPNLTYVEGKGLGVRDHGDSSPAIDNSGDRNGVRIDFDDPVDKVSINLADIDFKDDIKVYVDLDGARDKFFILDASQGDIVYDRFGNATLELDFDHDINSVTLWTTNEQFTTDSFYIKSVVVTPDTAGETGVHAVEAGSHHDYLIDMDGPDVAATLVGGNVLLNDTDVDDLDYGDGDHSATDLSVIGVRYGHHYESVDQDGDPTVIVGKFGTLTIHADGSYTYDPNTRDANKLNDGETGEDTFTYVITDNHDGGGTYYGQQAYDSATLTITVEGTNDAPIARPDINHIVESVGGDTFDVDTTALAGHLNDSGVWVDPNFSITAGTAHNHYGNVSFQDGGRILTDDGNSAGLGVNSPGNSDINDSEVDTLNGDDHWTEALSIDFQESMASVTITLSSFYKNGPDGSHTEQARLIAYDAEGNQIGFVDVHGTTSGVLEVNLDGASLGTDSLIAQVVVMPLDDGANYNPHNSDFLIQSVSGTTSDAIAHVDGNVIDGAWNGWFHAGRDTDIDNAHHELSVVDVEQGTSHGTSGELDGVNYDFVLQGQYGTLYLQANGDYTYVENPDATDPLNWNDTDTDVFTYTISDNQPGVELHDMSTLTITVHGSNDAPVARNDHNALDESIGGSEFDVDTTALAGHVNDAGVWVDSNFSITAGSALNINGGVSFHEGGRELTDDGNSAGLGVNSPGNSDINDSEVDTLNGDDHWTEALSIDFQESMASVTITLSSFYQNGPDGSHTEEARLVAYNAEGEQIGFVDVQGTPSGVLEVTLDGASLGTDSLIAQVVVLPLDDGANYNPHNSDFLIQSVSGTTSEAIAQVDGNVIDGAWDGHAFAGRDTDVDNAHYELSVVAVEQGTNPGTPGELDGVDYDFVLQGQYGTLYLQANGDYTYVENPAATDPLNWDDSATDVFTYTISDNESWGHARTDSATLTITVNGSNDAPVAFNNTPTTEVAEVTVSDFADAAGLVSYSVNGMTFTAQSTQGEPELDHPYNLTSWLGVDHGADQSAIDGNYGDDSIRIDFELPQESVTITLGAFNAYGESDDTAIAKMYDAGGNFLGSVTLNYDSHTNTFVLNPGNGFIDHVVVETNGAWHSDFYIDSVTALAPVNGGVDVHAAEESSTNDLPGDAHGDMDAIAVAGNVLADPDAEGNIDSDVDNLDYTDANTPPVELSVVNIVFEGDTTVLGSDGTAEIEGNYGTLVIKADGTYTYTPDSDKTDALNEGDQVQETFTYTVSDNEPGHAQYDMANLVITLDGSNDAPVATADSVHQLFNGIVTKTFDNWFGADGDAVFHANGITVTALSSTGEAALEYHNGNLGVRTGNDNNDEIDNSGPDEGVRIDFELLQDHVVLDLDGFYTGDDATITLYDLEGDLLGTLNLSDYNNHVTLDASALTGGEKFASIVIQTPSGFSSEFTINSISAKVLAYGSDGDPSEDASQWHFSYPYVIEGDDVTGNVLLNDSDIDNGDWLDSPDQTVELSVSGIASDTVPGNAASHDDGVFTIDGKYGTLTIQANGRYFYEVDQESLATQELDDDFDGTEEFTYTIVDPGGLHSTASLSFTVQGANDAPVAENDELDGTVSVFTTNFADADGLQVWETDGMTFTALRNGSPNGWLEVRDDDNGAEPNGMVGVSGDYDNSPAIDGNGWTDSVLIDFDDPMSSVTISLSSYAHSGGDHDDVTFVLKGINGEPLGTVNVENTDTHEFTFSTADTGGAFIGSIEVQSTDSSDDFYIDWVRGEGPAYVEDTSITISAADILANDTDIDDVDMGDAEYNGSNLDLSIASVFGEHSGPYSSHGGSATLNEDGSVTFSPDDDFNGTAWFWYVAKDDNGDLSNPAKVTLNIANANDAPTANPDTDSVYEYDGQMDNDGPLYPVATGNILTDDSPGDAGDSDNGADTDPDNQDNNPWDPVSGPPTLDDQLSLVSVTYGNETKDFENGDVSFETAYGRITFSVDGSYTYVATEKSDVLNVDNDGQEVFSYVMQDEAGAQSGSTLTIDVLGINDAATFTERNVVEATEDSGVDETTGMIQASGTVVADDVDSPETFNPSTQHDGYGGTFTILANGNWTYTVPNDAPARYDAVQSLDDGEKLNLPGFTVTSADGTEYVVHPVVNGVNDAPVALDDAFGYIPAQQSVITDVDHTAFSAANNWSFGGVTLTASGIGSNPVLVDSGDGVGVQSGNDYSSTQIDGKNDESVTINFDQGQHTATITLNWYDTDDAPTFIVYDTGGQVIENADLIIAPPVITGTAAYNQETTYEYTVTANGDQIGSIEVQADFYQPNPSGQWYDAADFVVQSVHAETEGTPAQFLYSEDGGPITLAAGDILANDYDVDIEDFGIGKIYDDTDPLYAPVGGTVSMVGDVVTFSPEADFNGTASFWYSAYDGTDYSAPAKVTIAIAPTDDPVTARDDTGDANGLFEVTEDGTAAEAVVTGNVILNDEAPDGWQTNPVSGDVNAIDFGGSTSSHSGYGHEVQGTYGTLYYNEDGTFRYELDNDNPALDDLDDTTTETFGYTATDSDGSFGTANLVISVNGVVDNTGPTAVPDEYNLDTGFNVVTEAGVNVTTSSSNYLIMLDRSRSMSDQDRIEPAEAAIVNMLQKLQSELPVGAEVKIGMVDFSDTASTQTFTLVGGNPNAPTGLNYAISQIDTGQTGVWTNYDAAFQHGYAWAQAHPGATQAIFISDGDPTTDINGVSWETLSENLGNLPGVNLTAVALGEALDMGNLNDIDETGQATVIDDDDPTGLQSLLVDIVDETNTDLTTASGNVIDGHGTALPGNLLPGEDSDPDGDDLEVVSISHGTETITLADPDTSDTDTTKSAVIKGEFGTLHIDENGEYTYTPDQAAADALNDGDHGVDTFTYTIVDTSGEPAQAEVTFWINGANDGVVAVGDMNHGASLTTTTTTPPAEWVHHDGVEQLNLVITNSMLNGQQTSINPTGSGMTITGSSPQDFDLVFHSSGLGIETEYTNNSEWWKTDTWTDANKEIGNVTHYYDHYFDSYWPSSNSVAEGLTISFDNPQGKVVIALNGITGSENVTAYAYYGSNPTPVATATVVNGQLVLIDDNYSRTNAQALITRVELVSEAGTSYTLDSVTTYGPDTWTQQSQPPVTTYSGAAVTGFLQTNDYDVDTVGALSVVLLDSTGTWGNLTLDSTTLEYTYTPDVDALNASGTPPTGSFVETFTYEVTSPDGTTDVGTLLVPVNLNPSATVELGGGDNAYTGVATDDVIDGQAGSDSIHGGAGDDLIYGGEGNDILNGGTGNDIIFGGAGDDIINVSTGNDVIALGEGKDVVMIDVDYLADNGGANVTIADFSDKDGDVLDLNNANGYTLNFQEVLDDASATGSHYLQLTLSDGDADSSNDIVIKLMGAHVAANPPANDFVIDSNTIDDVIQQIIDSPDNN